MNCYGRLNLNIHQERNGLFQLFFYTQLFFEKKLYSILVTAVDVLNDVGAKSYY